MKFSLGKRSRNRPVTAVVTHALIGAFSNAVVEAMAVADALAGFFTAIWGDDNREPRTINAVNAGVGVSTEIAAHNLHGELAKNERTLETTAPKLRPAEDETLAAAHESEKDDARVVEMEERCASEGIGVPDHRVARMMVKLLGLAVLGVGDVKFCSLAFEVFGLSDRSISPYFPVSEVQALATSVIAALLISVGIAGARLVRFWHALETAPQPDTAKDRRRKTRVFAEASLLIVGVGGGFCAMYGVSGVRAAFLAEEGVAAHFGEFFLIQIGVATAGLTLSAWESHPLDREWRSVSHRAKTSRKRFRQAYVGLIDLVGFYNGLLREREAILGEALAYAHALVNHPGVQVELYARQFQLSLSEPTTDRLLPDDLPKPEQQRLIDELDNYFAGSTSIFKKYGPVDLERVETVLKQIRARREKRAKLLSDFVVSDASATDALSPEKAATNGHSPRKPVIKA